MTDIREGFIHKNRIIIKIGSSTLTHASGKLNYHRIEKLVMEIADLQNQGKQMILVTSAAVSAGMAPLGLSERPQNIREKQALAAVGQGVLMNIYEKMFRDYGQTVGQILLTRMDSYNRKNFMNLRNTLLTLLDMGVIPVINENDAVAIDELKIGDNDTLSAIVASIVDADLLVILSDVDGLYTANPLTHAEASVISQVDEINKHIYDIAGGAGTSRGTGGMYTKIQAAAIAAASGVDMVIASGSEADIIRRVCDGEVTGTLFKAKDTNLHTKKRWLVSGLRIHGSIIVDKGCRDAIVEHGSSVLPVGVVDVIGDFGEGDIIEVSYDGLVVAKGIVNYDSGDVQRIKGVRTTKLSDILGHDGCYEEVIHRDNLVVMQ
ncbi:glutamate 5-kinase [Megasphaera paucivorans]|uniref:Glutamate 5-kinase n=1 Tax=Megasphaera paucivorans TaxID=349095 RepID=A0A1G9YIM4_9FIRM|nr:glutamate 5-kinase [Megasphaera paucivorans]SDN08880.1 glutamate 5-kinase [Megasphaera paucivorans]